MQYTLKNNTIKIDNGDHYYTGEVLSNMFPEEIRDNYEEIINQSFENYTDDKYSVSIINNFEQENPSFTINFQYNVKPFTFKRNISIPLKYNLKNFQDYTNERIEKLDDEILNLKNLVNSLLNKNTIEDDSDLDDNDSTLSEDIVEVPVKGGKKTVVVQMKGGRQNFAKK